MKKSVFFLLILLALPISAQQYVSFPTENAEWNVLNEYSYVDYPFAKVSTLLKYTLRGDTIINDISYKKICLIKGISENPVYIGVGGLRESNKQIFYVGQGYFDVSSVSQQRIKKIADCGYSTPSTSENEILLYDFNVHEGDQVLWGYKGGEIEKIDSILVGHSYRKTYRFKYSNELVIEGIGNVTSGLFGWATPMISCGDGFIMEHICFSQNGESLYLNPTYLDCNSTEKLSSFKYFGKENHWYYRVDIVQNYDDHFMTDQNEYLKGDTLINGKSYMIFTGESYLGVRENNKKVYSISLNNSENHEESLLYDFDVKVGDTIRYKPLFDEYSKCPVVRGIENISMRNGEQRKMIYIDNDTWIEGIGSTNGFLHIPHPIPTCDCGGTALLSFERNDSLIYHNAALCASTWFCNNPVDDVPLVNQNKLNVTFSPNPATNFVKVEFAANTSPCTSLELMDFSGKRIRILQNPDMSGVTLNLSTYRSGIYFVKLRYESRSESHKLIKL